MTTRPTRQNATITDKDFTTVGRAVRDAADEASARTAMGALSGVIVDSTGATLTTKRARFVLDENGEIDDILTEET